MDDSGIRDLIEENRAALLRLEARVARLETGPQNNLHQADTETASIRPEKVALAANDYLASLAIVCFVLIGALLLRIATKSGWLGPLAGVSAGLAYCALLLIGPVWPAGRIFSGRLSLVLQLCGIVLVALLVLESYHRLGALSADAAATMLFGFGAAAQLMGGLCRRRILAAFGLWLSLIGLAGLGLSPDALVLRAAAVVGLCCLALVVSVWRAWSALRTMALAAAGALLGLAVMAAVRREGIPAFTSLGLIVCVLIFWIAVLVNHLAGYRRLAAGEAAWLGLTSIWAFALVFFYAPLSTARTAPVVGVVLFCASVWLGGRRPNRADIGLALAGSLLIALGLLILDPSGLGLAILALGVFWAGRVLRSLSLKLLSQILVVGAAAVAVARTDLLSVPIEECGLCFLEGFSLGVLLLFHYVFVRRSEKDLDQSAVVVIRAASVISLTMAFAVLFGSVRVGLVVVFGRTNAFELAQSWTLALFSMGAMVAGKRAGSQPLRWIALIGLGALALKVLFLDLPSLGGEYAAGAVAALGAASLVASVVLRGKGNRIGDGHPGNG